MSWVWPVLRLQVWMRKPGESPPRVGEEITVAWLWRRRCHGRNQQRHHRGDHAQGCLTTRSHSASPPIVRPSNLWRRRTVSRVPGPQMADLGMSVNRETVPRQWLSDSVFDHLPQTFNNTAGRPRWKRRCAAERSGRTPRMPCSAASAISAASFSGLAYFNAVSGLMPSCSATRRAPNSSRSSTTTGTIRAQIQSAPRLRAEKVSQLMKRAAERAGLTDPQTCSGHSPRRGAAVELRRRPELIRGESPRLASNTHQLKRGSPVPMT
jgi:hypothetical protein